VIPVAKMTVKLDSENVQSLLQGDLTCVQSVVKDLIEQALETKAEEILQAKTVRADAGAERLSERIPQ
jgi:hypothetical protein